MKLINKEENKEICSEEEGFIMFDVKLIKHGRGTYGERRMML